MKNMLWMAAAALVAMTGCSKNEEPNPEPQGEAIGFKTFVNKSVVNDWTKGTPIGNNTYPEGTSFGVFAYYTTSAGGWSTDAATATPNFMYNQPVEMTASGCTYSPVKYWPGAANDKVTFFAYSPYKTADNGVALVGTNATAGVPSIEYTVPQDVAKQVDLMYASAENKSKEQISLTFNHALTQVKFSAKMNAALPTGTSVKVTELKVSGVDMSGKVSLATGAVTLSGSAAGTFTWSDLAATFTNTEGVTPQGLSGNEALMLLPQAISGITVDVTYEVTVTDGNLAGDGTVTTSYTKTGVALTGDAWAAAQRVNYLLTLDLSGDAVDITAAVGNWSGETTPAI